MILDSTLKIDIPVMRTENLINNAQHVLPVYTILYLCLSFIHVFVFVAFLIFVCSIRKHYIATDTN